MLSGYKTESYVISEWPASRPPARPAGRTVVGRFCSLGREACLALPVFRTCLGSVHPSVRFHTIVSLWQLPNQAYTHRVYNNVYVCVFACVRACKAQRMCRNWWGFCAERVIHIQDIACLNAYNFPFFLLIYITVRTNISYFLPIYIYIYIYI
jgi:hypothetical protein